MAYFGKEYRFDKDENYDAFVTAFGLSKERAKVLLAEKPNKKLEKVGNDYKLVYIMSSGKKYEFPFQIGVPVEENYGDLAKAKTVWTVNGDTFTQTQDFGDVTITNKMEFSPSQVKVTLTSSKLDSVAYKYYVAV